MVFYKYFDLNGGLPPEEESSFGDAPQKTIDGWTIKLENNIISNPGVQDGAPSWQTIYFITATDIVGRKKISEFFHDQNGALALFGQIDSSRVFQKWKDIDQPALSQIAAKTSDQKTKKEAQYRGDKDESVDHLEPVKQLKNDWELTIGKLGSKFHIIADNSEGRKRICIQRFNTYDEAIESMNDIPEDTDVFVNMNWIPVPKDFPVKENIKEEVMPPFARSLPYSEQENIRKSIHGEK
jgi:hypothetical protein